MRCNLFPHQAPNLKIIHTGNISHKIRPCLPYSEVVYVPPSFSCSIFFLWNYILIWNQTCIKYFFVIAETTYVQFNLSKIHVLFQAGFKLTVNVWDKDYDQNRDDFVDSFSVNITNFRNKNHYEVKSRTQWVIHNNAISFRILYADISKAIEKYIHIQLHRKKLEYCI